MKPAAAHGKNGRALLLRAPMVIPVSRPPIRDGAILLSGPRILAVGGWRDLSRSHSGHKVELADSAVLPGLVNAHCHLDYTHMAGHIAPPTIFTEWLKLITELKAGWTREDYAASWMAGAQMLLRSGTTTVGDMEAVPELLPETWSRTPLRVLSFLELIGITQRRSPEMVLAEARQQMARLTGLGHRVGLSPHAPYSTVPDLLQGAGALARRRRLPLSVHAGESALEYEMFTRGSGAMFEWIQRSGRDMSDCGCGTPVQHLERAGLLGKNLLIAHANYLGAGDARRLGKARVHVVHCPRSHFYFNHDKFPLNSLKRAGVNVCLGTDSLVSVYRSRGEHVTLDMFEEMRTFKKKHPSIAPGTILQMATLNGARALGMAGQAGELVPGAFADLIAVPLPRSTRGSLAHVLEHRGPVSASMIGGKWVIEPNS